MRATRMTPEETDFDARWRAADAAAAPAVAPAGDPADDTPLSREAETLLSQIETYGSLLFDQAKADDETAFGMAYEIGSVRQTIERTIREWDAPAPDPAGDPGKARAGEGG